MTDARVVLSTIGNADDAKRVSRLLVEERLAACVSAMPVESCYMWEGKLAEDAERLLVIKTTAGSLAALERRLRELHPYAVPEFVVIEPESVATSYLAWLVESVNA
ncbi:MAG: divalent-cation tolerance protein CutA [Acidobacteria bacterium]|nr:divalent-cation tolerance protein CutA [Acidobacteriota bacterium]